MHGRDSARSNFSLSPRHLEVKVAELQLKKVIFLDMVFTALGLGLGGSLKGIQEIYSDI